MRRSLKIDFTQANIQLKTWQLFMLLLLSVCTNIWIVQNHIMTQEVYHHLLSGQLEVSRIDDYFHFLRKISGWSYFLAPLILLIRIAFVALLIQFPLVFRFIDIPLRTIFRIVAFAALPLLIMTFLKNLWLVRLPASHISEQALAFMPLSLTNFIDYASFSKTNYGLLSNFNLFEVVWCIVIAEGLHSTKKMTRLDAFLMVLVIWTLILLFQWGFLLYMSKVYS